MLLGEWACPWCGGEAGEVFVPWEIEHFAFSPHGPLVTRVDTEGAPA
jgi:hypothetical protein